MRGLLIAAALAIAVALALNDRVHAGSVRTSRSSARAAPALVTASYYGVNGGLAFAPGSRGWPAAAAAIARLGVGVVRRDAFWSAVEPSPPRRGVHTYHWQSTDRLASALAASALRWYPIVDFATAWSGVGGEMSPPQARHVGDYAAFAGALARRYGSGGVFWRAHPRLPAEPVEGFEIWNEPNTTRFWPEQSYAPGRLAEMYLAARAQIHAVDPSARVVLGGLSAIGVEAFLTRMLHAQPALRGQLDAVGYHPYGGGDHAGLSVTYARIRTLRTALDRLFPGASVPIEITETGWAVPWVPESWRSQRLENLAYELPGSGCGVSRFIVYTWTSADAGPSPEAWFGIAGLGGTSTESTRALSAGIARARTLGSVPAGSVPIC